MSGPSEDGAPGLAFATEETYLHATDRVAEEELQHLLVVEVDHESYGLPTEAIREIIRVGEITEVPRLPAFLLGIISVRGAIIPVLDLRRRLGFAPAYIGRGARIVIVASGTQRFGLRVDGVAGLERFRVSEIESAPAVFGAGRAGAERYIQGIGRALDPAPGLAARIVVFLDLTTLLSFGDELVAHREARRRRDPESVT